MKLSLYRAPCILFCRICICQAFLKVFLGALCKENIGCATKLRILIGIYNAVWYKRAAVIVWRLESNCFSCELLLDHVMLGSIMFSLKVFVLFPLFLYDPFSCANTALIRLFYVFEIRGWNFELLCFWIPLLYPIKIICFLYVFFLFIYMYSNDIYKHSFWLVRRTYIYWYYTYILN